MMRDTHSGSLNILERVMLEEISPDIEPLSSLCSTKLVETGDRSSSKIALPLAVACSYHKIRIWKFLF